ncbi:WD40 repeat-like protein [Lactarius sanguifluus]|nr:WD40 repeat-like protein [Lactarius sanguifluus]
MGSQDIVWKPPVFRVSRQPTLVHKACLLTDTHFTENFARSAKWCPDGSLALAHCENRTLQYLDITEELFNSTLPQPGLVPPFDPPKIRIFPQAAPILDFIWYPRATPRDASSFCFIASVRESPVRLLDASDGRLRASYKIVDHRERQIAPSSLAFNVPADKLYCGFEDAIEVFDLSRPGSGTRLATTPSKKSRDGLKGIISALAFCPMNDPSYRLFAAGSLSPSSSNSSNIALFDEDTGGKPIGWIGNIKASVTQLAFNPMKPHILYASFRRRDEICAWDLRGDTVTPLQTFRRGDGRGQTNQKMKFDIDLGGNLLGVGGQNGKISVFELVGDLTESAEEAGAEVALPSINVVPALEYHAHDDAVGSVAFHPLHPLLLAVSGSRHFDPIGVEEESPGSDLSITDEEVPRGDGQVSIRRHRYRPQPSFRDNSFSLWFGESMS